MGFLEIVITLWVLIALFFCVVYPKEVAVGVVLAIVCASIDAAIRSSKARGGKRG